MPRIKLGHAVLLVSSLVLSLILAETVCWLMLPPPGFVRREVDDPPGLWVAHPTRGFAYARQFAGTMASEDFSITVRTDARGFRTDREREISTGSRPIVLAVGDSFTFGWGVNFEEAWPARLESILGGGRISEAGPLVVNAGVSGYSVRQIRTAALELIQELNPKVVVLGIYPAAIDRLFDPYVLLDGTVVRSSAVPHLKASRDRFLFSPMFRPAMEAADFWLDEHWRFGAYIWKALYEVWERESAGAVPSPKADQENGGTAGDHEIQPLLDELETIRAFVSKKRTRLMVLSIVGQTPTGTFSSAEKHMNGRLLAWCTRSQIVCVDVLPVLEARSRGAPIYRFKNDPHWSRLAHEVGAEEIAKRFHPSMWARVNP